MIQRTLLQSMRTAARQTQSARLAQTPFASSRLTFTPIASQRLLPQQRWYSESEAKKGEVIEDQAAAQGQASEAAPAAKAEDPAAKELEAKNKEVIDLTDRLKRTIADYRNLQSQTTREIKAAKDFALQRFAKDLLDSIDNLDRALTTVPADKLVATNPELISLHGGLKMTEEILMNTLKRHGMERFDPTESEGGKFDPNKMEATFQAPQAGKEDGSVFFTQSKGFLLNGRVLRAAKVGVVKNS